jgi:hypothetical protein
LIIYVLRTITNHPFYIIVVANLPKRVAHMQLGLEREISEEEEEVVDDGQVEYEYVTEDYEVIEEV